MTRQNDSGQSLVYTVPQGGTGRTSLTSYGLIMGNGTGQLALIGTGTAGQTPVSAGAGADAVWNDSKNAGFTQLITRSSVSSAANINFTNLSSSMIAYLLVIDSWDPASASAVYVRFSTDNGSSYISTSNYFYSRYDGTNAAAGTTAQAQIVLNTGGNVATTSGVANHFEILLLMPAVTNTYCGIMYSSRFTSSGNRILEDGQGGLTTSAAINAFRVFPSTGNIDSANFTLYGLSA